MSSDLTSLRAEIIHSLEHTLDAVLPWFVSQMPAAYFADTPDNERLAHLRAILAARASGIAPRITLHSEDRARWTFLMDGDRPGLLKEILDQLPAEAPLRQVKVHISADGQLAIDTIVLGDVPRFDPADAAQQGHTLAQAGFVVGNFATHRSLGNCSHFGLAPGGIGDFVYALNVDQGGVHVKGNQLEV